MRNGNNASGMLFDVVDEDGDVIGSFDDIGEAVSCGRSAPWYHGACDIRRDAVIVAEMHASSMRARSDWARAFYDAA